MARGKADLVAVGRISRRRGLRQLALRELSGQSLRERLSRVAAARHAHRLMDVSTAGKRVADAAADAGSSAAEGLDLGGVVVRLVFKHQQPVLLLAVHLGGHVNGAGVDLLALVEFGQQAALFEGLGTDGCNVHQRLGALGGLFRAVDLFARGKVALIRALDGGIVDRDLIKMRRERRVAAVIGPVGVDDAHLGHGGIAVLFLAEIGLQGLEIVQVHRKAHGGKERRERSIVHGDKALDRSDALGIGEVFRKRFRLCKRGLTALNRVDDIAFDGFDVLIRQRAVERIDLCRADARTLALAQKLDALCRAVGALIKLTGQRLDGKHGGSAGNVGLLARQVELRLGKDGGAGIVEEVFVHALCIVAVPDAHALQTFEV